jgi:hypothetical protein
MPMSEQPGRPSDPTAPLPAAPSDWAVASAGHPAMPQPGSPAAEGHPDDPWGQTSATGNEHGSADSTAVTGGVLPPPPGPYAGWQRPDVVHNGPTGPSRRVPIGLAAAGGAVLIAGAAFAAGMAIANHGDTVQTTSSSTPLGGQGDQLGQGGQGQLGQGQQAAPNGGQLPSGIGSLVAAGQISAINGSTLQVQGQQGVVTVKTSNSTQVEADLGGSVDALQVGDLIFVAGSTAADGSVTAQAIADRPFFGGIRGSGQGTSGQGTG